MSYLQLIPLSFRPVLLCALRRKMTPKKWVGLAVGFVGLFPILFQQSGEELTTGHFLSLSWAEFSVLGAVVASVYGWILLRQLIEEKSNYNISCKRIQHDRRRSPCSHSLLPHRKMDTLSRNRLSIF